MSEQVQCHHQEWVTHFLASLTNIKKYICTAQIKYSIVHAEVSHDIQSITFSACGSQGPTFTSTIV